jgi:hypothetical protein
MSARTNGDEVFDDEDGLLGRPAADRLPALEVVEQLAGELSGRGEAANFGALAVYAEEGDLLELPTESADNLGGRLPGLFGLPALAETRPREATAGSRLFLSRRSLSGRIGELIAVGRIAVGRHRRVPPATAERRRPVVIVLGARPAGRRSATRARKVERLGARTRARSRCPARRGREARRARTRGRWRLLWPTGPRAETEPRPALVPRDGVRELVCRSAKVKERRSSASYKLRASRG